MARRSYRNLAQLRRAAEVADTDPKAAITAYGAVATDSSAGPVLQDLAALRIGSLQIDQSATADAVKRLEPLAAADRPFRHTARELLALAAWRSGNAAEVKRWYRHDHGRSANALPRPARVSRCSWRCSRPRARVEGEPMNRAVCTLLMAATLALPLGGCGSMPDAPDFDPTDWFAGDWFKTKKPLPGERKELFPAGCQAFTRRAAGSRERQSGSHPERRIPRRWSRSRSPNRSRRRNPGRRLPPSLRPLRRRRRRPR